MSYVINAHLPNYVYISFFFNLFFDLDWIGLILLPRDDVMFKDGIRVYSGPASHSEFTVTQLYIKVNT